MRKSLTGVLLICVVLSLALVAGTVYAHTPHDDVYGLEISPDFATDQTAFALVRGTFFRTEDGGTTWLRQVKGLDNTHGLHSLAMSPQSSNTLYASSIGDGVYKSTDAGHTWATSNNLLPDLAIRYVIASKTSEDIVLAVGNQSGLYRTDDGGATWQVVDEGMFSDIHLTGLGFQSENSPNVYAGDEDGNIYSSNDLGLTWEYCCAIADAGAITAIEFYGDQIDVPAFFVGTESAGVFKTSDGGKSFVAQNEGLTGTHIQSLAVSPNFANDQTVYAVTRRAGVFRSDDEGASWSEKNVGLTINNQAISYDRPSFSQISASPSFAEDNTLFLAAFTGIFKTEDRADSWQSQETLPAEIVVGLAVAPDADNEPTVGITHYINDAFIVSKDDHFHIEVTSGLSSLDPVETAISPLLEIVHSSHFTVDDSRLLSGITRLHDIAFSPDFAADKTAFVSLRNYLLRTRDGGKSWDAINISGDPLGIRDLLGPRNSQFPYVIAPTSTFATDQTLFLGTSTGLILVSRDGGDTVESLGTIDDQLTALLVSPEYASDGVLFVSGFNTGIFKSVDGGKTWSPANNGLGIESGTMAGEFQLAISPNYGTDQTLFAATVAGLFKSADGGANWNKVACDICDPEWNVAAVAVSPDFANDGVVMISVKGTGLFKSTDGGESFRQVADNLIDENISPGNLDETPATSGAIKFSPNFANDKTIYGFSGVDLTRSVDGGETWSKVPSDFTAEAHTNAIHLLFGQYLFYPLALAAGVLVIIALVVLAAFAIKRLRS